MADTELYETLGVSRHATDTEIRKAYHRLAKQHHPDRTASDDDEKFKTIQFAYEVLSDPERREMYDRFGMSAVKEDGSGGPGMSGFPFGGDSIFSSFFGGGDPFFGGGRRRRAKGETIGIPLEVTLEELFEGATKSVEFKKKSLCKTCHGTGGKSGSVIKCKKCRGIGIYVTHRPIGPGMVQQIQAQCSDCAGTGNFVREKDRCKKCKGKRLLDVDTKIEVPITPGMRHDQKIPFRGQADELLDGDPGDLIVILQQMDHDTFKRQGIDLFVEKKISLRDALCGFEFGLVHLDGRKLTIKCPAGKVISPGTIRGIGEEGMPQIRHSNIRGNLYIQFDVEFPDNAFLGEEDLKKLEALLPAKPDEPEINEEEAEEVHLHDPDTTKGFEQNSHGDVFDSDDDDSGGGHRVGCTQQ